MEVKFYRLDTSCERISDTKVSEVWGPDQLRVLKAVRPWWHPNVSEVIED